MTSKATGSARSSPLGVAEYALLGLLARDDPAATGGVHGYVLVRKLADGALGDVLRLESGMLYHFLKKLARMDLVVTSIERQQGRPDRQLHALTDRGRTELRAWLAEPVRATRDIRLDFLVKLYLVRALDGGAAAHLVAEQIRVTDGLAASLTSQQAALDEASDPDGFRRSVIALRLSQTAAARIWLAALPEAS